MKGGFRPKTSEHGFTIMETMIVLVVTGALFLSVAGLVSGRQQKNEFLIGSRGIQTQVQQTISDVTNGYYPNLNDFSCANNGANKLVFTGSGSEQGTNAGCIFLGKVFLFGNAASGSDDDIKVFTVAGLRMKDNDVVTNLTDARPTLIYNNSSYAPGAPTDIDTYHINYGLKAVSGNATAYLDDASGASVPIGGFAVLTTLDRTTDPTASDYHPTAARQVDIIPIVGSSVSQGIDSFVGHADCYLQAANDPANSCLGTPVVLGPDSGVHICFASGGTNQSALITVGANNSATSVGLDIKDGQTCGF